MKDVIPNCQSLIQFVAKADPLFIQEQSSQVMSIYTELTELEDMEEDKRESTAAKYLNHGTNLVGQYIAA